MRPLVKKALIYQIVHNFANIDLKDRDHRSKDRAIFDAAEELLWIGQIKNPLTVSGADQTTIVTVIHLLCHSTEATVRLLSSTATPACRSASNKWHFQMIFQHPKITTQLRYTEKSLSSASVVTLRVATEFLSGHAGVNDKFS